MKRALVLSGGGARGSYEFGVWKALQDLGITFDIVTGCSVGAINGAIIAQNDYKIAEEVWQKINTSDVFYYDYDLKTAKGQVMMYYQLAKHFVKQGGLALDKMQSILETYIDEDRVRKSKIDLGIVTYSYTNKKPVVKSIKDIPKGKLIDFIIASSTCFPVVQPKQIDDELYLDGGYYDAMPINLAIDMGADEIIAVDLEGFGPNRRPKDRSKKITIIKPSNSLGSILSFTKEEALMRMKLGYIDTLKAFNKCEGKVYTFWKGSLLKNYKTLSPRYSVIYKIYFKIKSGEILNKEFRDMIDGLGKIYNIDLTEIYNMHKYNRLLLDNVINTKDDNLKQRIIYENMYNLIIEQNKKKANVNILAAPKLFKYSLYLYTVYMKSNIIYKLKFKRILRRNSNGSN